MGIQKYVMKYYVYVNFQISTFQEELFINGDIAGMSDTDSNSESEDEEENVEMNVNIDFLNHFRNINVEDNGMDSSDFPELRKLIDEPTSDDIVQARLNVSTKAILLAVIKFVIIHSLSMVGLVDLLTLINCLFNILIIPDTLFKIDKLFSSE